MDNIVLIMAPLVFIAYATEALTGFGSALIAVTAGAIFLPIDRLVPVVVPLNIVVTGYIAVRHRQEIEFRLVLTRVLPFMTFGIIMGTLLFPLVKGVALKWLLGLMVVVFAGRQLWVHVVTQHHEDHRLPAAVSLLLQIGAGIAQALYTTGGPLLVYSLGRLNMPKNRFRATMCTVWATMNTLIVVIFVTNGRINPQSLKVTGILMLILPLAILTGDWLHGKLDERRFRIFVYSLLLVSGAVLFF